MPKRVFFPLTAVVFGLIVLASNLGMLPREFWNLWPLMFIIVGLGGLLLSDKEEWDTAGSSSSTKKTVMTKKAPAKKVVAKKASSKKK